MTKLQKLKDMIKIQSTDGNWNHSQYMHGMANGMILALALLEDKDPVFLHAPDKWLCDRPHNEFNGFPTKAE